VPDSAIVKLPEPEPFMEIDFDVFIPLVQVQFPAGIVTVSPLLAEFIAL